MSRKLRWGILGVAAINDRLMPAFRASKTVDLRAVASRSPDKAKAYAAKAGIPVAFGSYDELLADPAKGLSADITTVFGGRLPYTEPDDVAELTDGVTMTVAGIDLTIDHAPGHTRGSVVFHVPDGDAVYCLSGDVLFAGSIGRTDLPGGSWPQMMASLRDKILPLDDAHAFQTCDRVITDRKRLLLNCCKPT